MNIRLEWWNKKHDKYAAEDWIDQPSIFSRWAVGFFPKKGKIIEFGAGHGQDTRFFAKRGYQVVSTDFSDTANEYNRKKLPEKLKDRVTIKNLDLSNPLPFGSNSFDIVYAHLAIHYFDDYGTNQVFSEIHRVLKPGGLVAILVNSIDDPEYGMGKKLNNDFFELSPGDVKHFFSLDYMRKKAKKFETIVLDNKGETHKDRAKGVFKLIRFIGKKVKKNYKNKKKRYAD